MPIVRDLKGKRGGRWTILRKADGRTPRGEILWVARCICGEETEVATSAFLQARSYSCGCYRRERMTAMSLGDYVFVEELKAEKAQSDEAFMRMKRGM